MSDEFSLNYSDSSSHNKSNNNQSHVLEQSALNSYQPPGCNRLVFHDENDDKHDNHDNSDNHQHTLPSKRVQWVYNPSDGSVLRDPSNGKPVSVDRLLATKPLRGELSTRPGPGNKKLTYISGDGVARTLNDIFGFDGWNLDITKVNREECLKDPKTGKFSVVYTAMVRVTHKASGAYREECGTGDSVDRHFGTAVGHALKGSITDAMKRAARHFGDKLGNSLYDSAFSITKAPTTLKEALDRYDIERANTKFGFAKDQKPCATGSDEGSSRSAVPRPVPETLPPEPVNQDTSLQRQNHVTGDPAPTNANPGRIVPSAPQGPTNRPQAVPKSTPHAHAVVAKSSQPPPPSTATANTPSGLAANQNRTNSIPRVEQDRPQVSLPIQKNQPNSNDIPSAQTPVFVPSVAMLPPPTPTDSLRNSGIFSFHDDYKTEGIPRPSSSYGKPCRSSLGADARPIQAPPLVTPTAEGSAGHKRSAPQSVGNLDPSQTKKATSSVSASHNPYGKISRM